MPTGEFQKENNAQPLNCICMNGNTPFAKNVLLIELNTDVPLNKLRHKSDEVKLNTEQRHF